MKNYNVTGQTAHNYWVPGRLNEKRHTARCILLQGKIENVMNSREKEWFIYKAERVRIATEIFFYSIRMLENGRIISIN